MEEGPDDHMDKLSPKDLITEAMQQADADPWKLVTTALSIKSWTEEPRPQSPLTASEGLDHIRQVYSWFCWNEPVGVYSETLGPVHLMFPFYRTVIVPVYPYPTAESFVQAYGITPEQMAELSRLGFVNLLLVSGIDDYRKPHLNPLASSGHLGHIFELSRFEARIRGIDLEQVQQDYDREIRRLFSRDSGLKARYPIVDLRTRLIELHILGFEQLVSSALRSKRKPRATVVYLLTAHYILAEPYFRGLNAFYNTDLETWSIATTRLKKCFPVILPGEKDMVLPAGLMRQFSLEFEFVSPLGLLDPVKYCTDLATSPEVIENHSLLVKLDRYVRDRDYVAAESAGADLAEHVVKDLNSEIASLERSRKRARICLSLGFCLGVGRGLDSILSQIVPSLTLPAPSLEVAAFAFDQASSGPLDKLASLFARSTVGFDSLPVLLWQRRPGHPWNRRRSRPSRKFYPRR